MVRKGWSQFLLQSFESGTVVELDARGSRPDHDALGVLHEFLQPAHNRDIEFVTAGLGPHFEVYEALDDDAEIVRTHDSRIRALAVPA
ncbi:MAG: hypothetical protein AAF799_14080 [Myxococcota bacterium]